MQFTSFDFLIFFPFVVLIFYIMPKRLRQLWLLLASYYFYMGWNAKYALLIFASTAVTYIGGIFIDKFSSDIAKKRMALAACILINLGLLGFFKYFYFLYDNVGNILSLFGITIKETRLNILLPVGISFYVFQAVGYIIDVYRQDVKSEKNFVRYALFVSFFPQLVAGPIERSKNLLGQIERISYQKSWDFDKVTRGLLLMLWGFFVKMVIADRAAIFVEQVFSIYYMFNGVALLVAAVLFTIQIYCDFSGYSYIAIGAARVLGIELMDNFAAPFLSRSISELWRRWHISLSSWFRDYVYIPLGGSRCSKPRKYFNNLVTFGLSGLWHGASWNYVVWGLMQSVYIIIGDITKPFKERMIQKYNLKIETTIYKAIQTACTFILFMLSLIIFRLTDIKDGVYYIYRMVTQFDVWSFFDASIYNMGLDRKEMGVLVFAVLILFLVDIYYQKCKAFFDTLVKQQCLAIQYIMVALILVMVIVFGIYGEGYDATQFIYFQF